MRGNGSTRNQILILLKTKGPLTVSEMAEHLGVTEMAVRRHLNTLERDQMVSSQLLRQAMGRPTSQYFLTEKSDDFFPKNYHSFTVDILEDLERTQGTEVIDQLFKNREKRLIEAYQGSFKSKKSLRDRVETLAKMQEGKGYMVKMEEINEDTFALIEHNCPIAQVSSRFTQACACELNLFRNILEADVEQQLCAAKGSPHCVYLIRAKKDGEKEEQEEKES
jgi:predicted ArsR family transcriptional regulator